MKIQLLNDHKETFAKDIENSVSLVSEDKPANEFIPLDEYSELKSFSRLFHQMSRKLKIYDIIFNMVKENNDKVQRLEIKSETFKSAYTPVFPAVDFQLCTPVIVDFQPSTPDAV